MLIKFKGEKLTDRIMDEKVLLEPTDFTVELDVSHAYPVKNADGSNPVATLEVKSPRLQSALFALNSLSEQEANQFLILIVEEIADKLKLPMDTSYDEIISNPSFGEAFKKEEWVTVGVSVSVDSENSESIPVNATLRAPSYRVAYGAFRGMTTPARLNALLASFMPVDEDED